MNMRNQLARLTRGAAQIISEAELAEKLSANRPLRVKLGVDPTSADIHLGHTVVLRKLRDFQEFGHQAILIIGDFTALIGDPSGRSVTRPTITRDEVERNAKTYREQAFKILDQKRTEIVFNGSWLGKLSFEDVIRLNSEVTLQQLLQREDFRARMKSEQPIHAHEIQYPIMQAYDSVMVKADVELGGTDQLFNILLGRDLQKENGQPQQIVLLMPILEGLDGKQKMSKSLGNYVALNDSPADMFGKLMSISDKLMARYYPLLFSRELARDEHPVEAKKQLARQIVATYHSPAAAKKVEEEWTMRFSEKRRGVPTAPFPPALCSSRFEHRQDSCRLRIRHCDPLKVCSNAAQLRIDKCLYEMQSAIKPREKFIFDRVMHRERDFCATRTNLGQFDNSHQIEI